MMGIYGWQTVASWDVSSATVPGSDFIDCPACSEVSDDWPTSSYKPNDIYKKSIKQSQGHKCQHEKTVCPLQAITRLFYVNRLVNYSSNNCFLYQQAVAYFPLLFLSHHWPMVSSGFVIAWKKLFFSMLKAQHEAKVSKDLNPTLSKHCFAGFV